MNTNKKLTAVIMAAILVLCAVVMLAACNKGKNFDIDLDNYLVDATELDLNGNGQKNYPTISEVSFDSSLTVNRSFQNGGLLVLQDSDSNKIGYLVSSGKQFGSGDELQLINSQSTSYNDGTLYVYVARDKDNNYLLYDCNGNKKLEASSVSGYSIKTVNDQTYLSVTVDDDATKYFAVNDDGSLGSALNELPKEESKYPQQGELRLTKVTLAEYLQLIDFYRGSVKTEHSDSFVEETTVATYGNTAIFYDGDDLLSTWQIPDNIMYKAYADGKIIYTVKFPVDSEAKDGYNFVDRNGQKYNCTTNSFDISTGKVKELKVDYVVGSAVYNFYNKTNNKYDLVAVTAYKQIDGVAWAAENACQDQIVINSEGEIGYSVKEHGFFPYAKAGDLNYIAYGASTYGMSSSLLLVDNSLNPFATVDNPIEFLSEGILAKIDDRLGIVGYDGQVKFGFSYTYDTYSSLSIGKYYFVTDSDGTKYILDTSKPTAHTLQEILGVDKETEVSTNSYTFPYLLVMQDSDTDLYNFYDLDGKLVLSGANSSNISVTKYTVGNRTYGYATVSCTVDGQSETVYLRFVF